jgi:hypothetical protein
MAKSYQQIFGQLANSYLNFANPLAKNHTRYGQLPSQGPAACNPYTSTPSYASNEPTPLIPQKFGVNAQHHSESSAKPNYNSDFNPNRDSSCLPSQDPNFNHSYSPQNGHRRALGRSSKGRRYLAIVLLLSKCVSATLSALMESSMVYMIYKYRATRNVSRAEYAGPWPKDPKLWPTLLLAVASGLTLLLTVGSVLNQICKTLRKSGQTAKGRPLVTTVKYAVHIGTWVCVAVAYRLGKTGDDLWGWSCSDSANAIQKAFESDVDFSSLCTLQVCTEPVLLVLRVLCRYAWKFSPLQSRRITS